MAQSRNDSGGHRRPNRPGGERRAVTHGRGPARRSESPTTIGRGARADPAPVVDDDVSPADLDRVARGRLRTLSKENAEGVAKHLVMVGRLLDDDPERAYEHAQAAVRRAGRVDVVREAAGLAAYRTGRYAEALRELRTARRLNGSDDHIPVMADCERGLGRPERALALAQEHHGILTPPVQVELAIVVSGARCDLQEPDAALSVLSAVNPTSEEQSWRIDEARAQALTASGRQTEAEEILANLPPEYTTPGAGHVEVVDLTELEPEDGVDPAAEGDVPAAPGGAATPGASE